MYLEVSAGRVPATIIGAVDQVCERGGERVDVVPVTHLVRSLFTIFEAK